jgi:hypothetical protein
MLSANGPGESQYLNPIGPGPIPPAVITIARMKKTVIERTLILYH